MTGLSGGADRRQTRGHMTGDRVDWGEHSGKKIWVWGRKGREYKGMTRGEIMGRLVP